METRSCLHPKQNQPVYHQNWPENRDIEDRKPSTYKRNSNRSRGRVPELELRKTANEGTELLVLPRWKTTCGTVLHIVVYGIVAGVEFRLEEGEEEV